MPLYHFSIRSDRFEDNEGFDLPDDMSARRHAVGIIHELQNADEDSWRDFTMEVRRDGQLVWEIHSSCADCLIALTTRRPGRRNAPAFRTAQALTQEGEIRASSETRYPQCSRPTTAKIRNASNKLMKNLDNDAGQNLSRHVAKQ
jgi:hypothetical protein